MTLRVFLSYSSKDAAAAQAACKALENGGIAVWMAPRNIAIGETWADAIPKAIREARAVVLIYSSHVNRSKFVPLEIQKAYSAGIPIIPVRLENTAPADSLDLIVSAFQWLDCFPPPFDRHLDKLVMQTRARLGGGVAAPPPPTPEKRSAPKPPDMLAVRPVALAGDLKVDAASTRPTRWTSGAKLLAATLLASVAVVGVILSWGEGQPTIQSNGPAAVAKPGSPCVGAACSRLAGVARSTVPGFDDMVFGPYEVVDAATLIVNNQYVSLANVGAPAAGSTPKLAHWMRLTGNSVMCRPSGDGRYRCWMGSANQFDVTEYILAEKLAVPLVRKSER